MTKAKRKQLYKKTGRLLLSCLVAAVLFLGLQNLLMPKYMGEIKEGAMIGEYYSTEKKHDVIILGDCEVYENISAPELMEQYGINAYIRGSAKQTMWQSYYLLEDTLSYETPDVVVLSVFAMQFNEPQSESFNRMTIDGMRFSKAKLACAKASMLEGESLASYVFPILRYHDRWQQLTKEDFEFYFRKESVTENGYVRHEGVKAASDIPQEIPLGDYRFGDMAYDYLDRITRLCKENDIRLILIKAPSLYPSWYQEWEQQVEDYASANGLQYVNCLEEAEEIGFDFATDTYDGGLHLNDAGAVKLADYLGAYLLDEVK